MKKKSNTTIEVHTYYGKKPFTPVGYHNEETKKNYIPIVLRDRHINNYYEVSYVFQEL